MTVKHLLEGVMQSTGARNHRQLAIRLEIENATVTRLAKGQVGGMRIETLDRIQQGSGVPIEKLFAWYRLPEGVTLGRVTKQA